MKKAFIVAVLVAFVGVFAARSWAENTVKPLSGASTNGPKIQLKDDRLQINLCSFSEGLLSSALGGYSASDCADAWQDNVERAVEMVGQHCGVSRECGARCRATVSENLCNGNGNTSIERCIVNQCIRP